MPESRTRRTERFELHALYETSQLLSASLDLEFVLNNLLLTAMSKLLVTRGVALLYDPLAAAHTVSAVKGIGALTCGQSIDIGASPRDTLLQGDEVPDVLAQLRVELVLPVTSGHREIGLIGLGPKATRQPFERDELTFIQSLVNMSSAAVHNSLIVEELRQANLDLDGKIQQLNTLFDLSQEFNATVDRDHLIKLLSFALMGQMLVGKHLFLLKGNTGSGPSDDDDPDDAALNFRVVSSKGIAAPALENALMQRLCQLSTLKILDDVEEDPVWEGLRQRGLVLALPIRHQGETCALLCLGPKMTGQAYGPDDLEFLTALGNLAFVSIQNTFLVEQQIEKERLEEEMRLAREIQERLQPGSLPRFPGADLAALALPSRHVAGDYYDLVPLDDDRLLLAIADVTGKGVPASLLMSNLQACLHVMVPMDISLEDAAAHINRVICRNTSYDKFITYFHAIYTRSTGAFQFVNAGHNPPMLLRTDGTLELLEEGGLLLGVMEGMPYQSGEVTLAPGDVVALFTDGVTEAMSPDEEEYHEDRLEAVLRTHHQSSAQAILDAVREDIKVFTDYAPVLSDDLTMIVLKILPDAA